MRTGGESGALSDAANPKPAFRRTTPWRLGRLSLTVLLGSAAVSAVLAVNIFPSLLNDSVVYLQHSRSIGEFGWVTSGFRQAGYPLALAGVREMAHAVGAEPLLAMSLVQRTLLAAGGALSWIYWRWWSIPLVVFLVSAETVAFTNFILIEGLGLPLALLLVFPTVSLIRQIRSIPETNRRRFWLLGSVIVLDVILLMSFRFTYFVFAAVPLVVVLTAWKTQYRRVAVALFSVFLVLAVALALALSLENQREFGVFSPNANGSPSNYYYSWIQIFSLNPPNSERPELEKFYDGGDVYDFGRKLGESGLSVQEQWRRYDREVAAMLAAAGLSPLGSRMESASWALLGGRMNDLDTEIRGIVSSTRSNVEDQIHRTNYSVDNGRQAFADQFNDSQLPRALITDPLGVPLSIIHNRHLAAILLLVALGVMFWSLTRPSLRPLSMMGLGVTIAMAVGLGWIRADNFRFLIATTTFGLAIATAEVAVLCPGSRHEPTPSSD